jgi:aldehyde dehydrogenase (NAD+)
MYEQWHPLGTVGIISAFNFPVAVWSWNLAIAMVCGDVCTWKPASHVPLTAIACQKIMMGILKANDLPGGISTLIIGRGSEIGEVMLEDNRMPLISYTGSTKIGQHISEVVSKRFGRTILELGGNNALIITPDADLQLAAKAVLFGAVGTAGQRCTSTRRVIVEKSIKNNFIELLKSYYEKVNIGNPLDQSNLMGPMVDASSTDVYLEAIEIMKKQGGALLWGGEKMDLEGGCYVTPSVAEVTPDLEIVKEETFAPLLYIIEYDNPVTNAIRIQNDVPQGLSSSIFTNNMLEAEEFLSAVGSDCGIANVNVGTSGAEIGLAFGGEKETGGGRESGSDAWKEYMRRQSNTINWSGRAELAQGIKFD